MCLLLVVSLVAAGRPHDSQAASGGGILPVPPAGKPSHDPATQAPPPTFVTPPNGGVITMQVVTSRRAFIVLRDDTGRVAASAQLPPGVTLVTLPIELGETWLLTVAGDDIIDVPVVAGQVLRITEP